MPKISFKHRFFLTATFEDGTKKYFSSLNDYNVQLPAKQLLGPVDYEEEREDPDSDGVKDQLNIDFAIHEASIAKLELNIFLTYTFDNRLRIQFTDMLTLKNSVKSGTKNLIYGHVELAQNQEYNEL